MSYRFFDMIRENFPGLNQFSPASKKVERSDCFLSFRRLVGTDVLYPSVDWGELRITGKEMMQVLGNFADGIQAPG